MKPGSGRDTRPRRRSMLGRRLVLATLGFSLMVAVLVTAGELAMTYQQERDAARARLDEIGSSLVPSLASSLWLVDLPRVNLLMDGIAQSPGVAFVDLRSSDGERIQRGDPAAAPWLKRRYRLLYREGGRFDLGTLDVVVGDRYLMARLRRQTVAISVAAVAALGLGALLLLLLLRRWVTRPLLHLANYARGLTLQTLDTPLDLDERVPGHAVDELDEVAESINRMRLTLAEELELRSRYEQELAAHREHLEDLVAARTDELRAKTEQLRRLANTDGLTGVTSRRHFGELAARELARARRSQEPLSLLMLDIDHFKAINDGHGHAIGDLVLQALARCCEHHLHDVDVVARMGGEEFAILLPGADSKAAAAVAERLRQALAAVRVDGADGRPFGFTVSVGVATLGDAATTIDALLKRADDALYAAKRAGRDRISVAPD